MLRNLSSTMFRSITPMCTRSICFRPNLAINGFGRIGKMLLRQSFGDSNINVSYCFQIEHRTGVVWDSFNGRDIGGLDNESIGLTDRYWEI